MRRWIYAGSFDPPTLGHLDIIDRASKLCDELIVALLINVNKKPVFSEDERVDMIRKCTAEAGNVRVVAFKGLLVDLAKELDCEAIVRGIRNAVDLDYENAAAQINLRLSGGLETVYLPATPALNHISSTAVREAASMGADLNGLVPDLLIETIAEKFRPQ